MKIKFTLDCFKEEFLKKILTSLNYSSYYDFLQNEKNVNFELEFNQENSTSFTETIKIKQENYDFQDENNELQEENSDLQEQENEDIYLLEDENNVIYNNQKEENIEQYNFLYYEKDNAVFLESDTKKHIPKSVVKKIKNQGGKWVKKENSWRFPKNQLKVLINTFGAEKREYSMKNPTKDKINTSLHSKSIEKIINKDGNLVIIPLQNHPMYGKKITYDNNFNMGIWDNNLKGWRFTLSKN